MSPFAPLEGGTMEPSWTFVPGRQKNPRLSFFFFSEKSSAGQLGSLQFLKEHSLEIEYYQKSANVEREYSIAVF